jgi:hypothetical protein
MSKTNKYFPEVRERAVGWFMWRVRITSRFGTVNRCSTDIP